MAKWIIGRKNFAGKLFFLLFAPAFAFFGTFAAIASFVWNKNLFAFLSFSWLLFFDNNDYFPSIF